MDTSDVYTQVFQSLMPLIQIAIVLWAAETILTMLIKEHRKSKKKKEREKRRLEYQDRRMANDEEHAKVTRAMRYDVLRRDGFRCVKCGLIDLRCRLPELLATWPVFPLMDHISRPVHDSDGHDFIFNGVGPRRPEV